MPYTRNYLNITMVLISLIIGAAAGAFGMFMFYGGWQPDTAAYVREGGYTFINPLLSCDISENKQFAEYKPIEDEFKTYIAAHTANGDAQSISVYFRGMNSGHWSGVNENATYSPASLLKVPLMIAYLKEAATDPGILQKRITYHQTTDGNSGEYYKPQKFIEDGKTYSISDLLQYMIAYSDNNAAALLQANVDQNSLSEVYTDLGIPISTTLAEQTMTPKIYSYLFRILYNATYLPRPLSQYALQLLAATDFSAGIKAGVPTSIPSAQKFGERSVFNVNSASGITLTFRELSDCGIVYYPKNPYLLCIMTKGTDFDKLSHIISDISALVYKETSTGVLRI